MNSGFLFRKLEYLPTRLGTQSGQQVRKARNTHSHLTWALKQAFSGVLSAFRDSKTQRRKTKDTSLFDERGEYSVVCLKKCQAGMARLQGSWLAMCSWDIYTGLCDERDKTSLPTTLPISCTPLSLWSIVLCRFLCAFNFSRANWNPTLFFTLKLSNYR